MTACKKQARDKKGPVKKVTVQASIVGAIRELVAMNKIPCTMSVARYLGRRPSEVNRELQKMARRGRVVKGERIGAIVPYYLREAIRK